MMVMHARDPARGLLTPRGMLTCVFARRVVRSMPTADADVATRHREGVRSRGRRDGVRSAMAAERTAAAMTTSTAAAMTTSTAAAMTTSTAAAMTSTAAATTTMTSTAAATTTATTTTTTTRG
jgi:hypothetical protein